MATKYTIEINDGDRPQPIIAGNRRESPLRLAQLLTDLASGSKTGVTLKARNTAVAASATVTLATSSGTITAIINGVSVAITWATSDTNSAALLAAAINASTDALVQHHVTATSALGVVTITAVTPGRVGNTITLDGTGTNVTESALRLTGGTDTIVTLSY